MNSPRTSKKKRSPSTSRKVKKESARNAAEAVQPRYRQARKLARSETRKPRHATTAADQAKWLPIQTIKVRETKPKERSKHASRFISKGRINKPIKNYIHDKSTNEKIHRQRDSSHARQNHLNRQRPNRRSDH